MKINPSNLTSLEQVQAYQCAKRFRQQMDGIQACAQRADGGSRDKLPEVKDEVFLTNISLKDGDSNYGDFNTVFSKPDSLQFQQKKPLVGNGVLGWRAGKAPKGSIKETEGTITYDFDGDITRRLTVDKKTGQLDYQSHRTSCLGIRKTIIA